MLARLRPDRRIGAALASLGGNVRVAAARELGQPGRGGFAPVAVQGQPGGQLQALRSTGPRPRTEQNGMSVHRRIPLQFVFQALRIGLHAYLLRGGHSGALD